MKLEPFAMERMQSTWENLVEMDMSESGVRPVSLRELAEMGLDIDSILSMPGRDVQVRRKNFSSPAVI